MSSSAETAFAARARNLGRAMAERDGAPPARKTPERYFYSRIRSAAERRNDSTFTLRYRQILDEHAPGWDVGLEWDEHDSSLARLERTDHDQAFTDHARSIGAAIKDGIPLTPFQARFLSSVRESARGLEVGRRFDLTRRKDMDRHVPGWDRTLVWEAPHRARMETSEEAFRRRAAAMGQALATAGRAGLSRSDREFLSRVRHAALGGTTSSRFDRRFDLARRGVLDAEARGWDAGLTFPSATAIKATRI